MSLATEVLKELKEGVELDYKESLMVELSAREYNIHYRRILIYLKTEKGAIGGLFGFAEGYGKKLEDINWDEVEFDWRDIIFERIPIEYEGKTKELSIDSRIKTRRPSQLKEPSKYQGGSKDYVVYNRFYTLVQSSAKWVRIQEEKERERRKNKKRNDNGGNGKGDLEKKVAAEELCGCSNHTSSF